MTASVFRGFNPGARSVPTDEDRARLERLAAEAVSAVRAGLDKALLDSRGGLRGLHGASIKRVYLKLVLQGVVRWVIETQSRDDVMASAHHVPAQDGLNEAIVAHGHAHLSLDKLVGTLLRTLAKALDDASRGDQEGRKNR